MKREKNKHLNKQIFCLFLCITMLITTYPTTVKANTFSYSNKSEKTNTSTKKKQNKSQEYVYGSADNAISRAEWIHNLVLLFDMKADEAYEPDQFFQDLTSDAPYYKDIMLALAYGVISVNEDGNFLSNESCTREFAVHTLNFCLGYQLQNKNYTFTDRDETNYPEDAQVALEQNWLALDNGSFCPKNPLTSDEVKTMIASAEKEWRSTEIDETYENQYQFSEQVTVVNSNVLAEATEDNIVTIYDSTQKIVQGDIFIVYINGLPVAYKANNIQRTNSNLKVTADSVIIENYLKEADAQGMTDLDLDGFIPAEGVTITKTDTDTADNAKRKESKAVKNIKTKTMKGTLKIAEGANVNFVCKFSKLNLEYQIEKAANNYYVGINGNADLSCTANFDLLNFLGQKKQVPLGNIPIAGVGCISLNMVLDVSGRVTVSYATNFSAGVKYSQGDLRLVKSFGHIDPSIDSQVNLQMGLYASAEFNLFNLIKGEIYAEGGLKGSVASKTYSDAPKNCTTIKFWCYAEIGAGVSFPLIGKNFSKKEVLLNEKNALLMKSHFEDGSWKSFCIRNPKERFSSFYSSKYAGIGISGYVDDTGKYIPVFTYELNDNGSATVTGYTGYARTLVIPDTIDGHTVVAIGFGAFKNRDDLKSVILPDTVTQLKDSCFANCHSLSSIDLGNSIESIEGNAFSGCSALVEALLPNSTSMIGCGSFKSCTSLYNLYVPKALKADPLMGANMYYPGAFEGCTNLQSVTFEKNILSLPSSLFVNCDGLKEIEIPDTVTSLNGGGGFAITLGIFENCSNLEKVKLSANTAKIGCRTFRNCVSLKEIELPESLTSIDVAAFKNCKSLESINIPAKLQTEDMVGTDTHYDGVFAECENLKSVTFSPGIKTIPKGLFTRCTGLSKVSIPDSVDTINTWAFSHCTSLKEIQIPDSAVNLGNAILQGCSNLESVTLPKSCSNIPEYLFEGCKSLTTVSIPPTVTHIGKYAFANCSSLTDITLPPALTEIDSFAFSACDYLSKITIPEQVNRIGGYVFEKCKKLSKVEIGKSVTQIGAGTFFDCDSLSEISLPNSVKEIGQCIFSNCDKLSKIKLSNGITVIPESAFEQCMELESIVIPYRVKEIRERAFADSPAFKVISIPKATTDIASSAFSYKTLLTVCGVKGSFAETYCQNENITFTAVTKPVTDIIIHPTELKMAEGDTAVLLIDILPEDFTDDVTWLSADESIATVDEAGIVKAKKAGKTKITVTAGTKVVHCTIQISGDIATTPPTNTATPAPGDSTPTQKPNDAFPSTSTVPTPTINPVKRIYKKGTKIKHSQSDAIYQINGEKKGVFTATYLKNIKLGAKKIIVADKVTIGNTSIVITAIDANAFRRNKKVTSIIVGKNIIKIGKGAFKNCSKLKKITFQTALLKSKDIGKNAFKGIPKTCTIKVPKSKKKGYAKSFRKKGLNKRIKIVSGK